MTKCVLFYRLYNIFTKKMFAEMDNVIIFAVG